MTRIVLCGSYHEFSTWLRNDSLHGRGAIFVSDVFDLIGRDKKEVQLIRYGNWKQNEKGIKAVERFLQTMQDGDRLEEIDIK
jgi:hypothetical protein